MALDAPSHITEQEVPRSFQDRTDLHFLLYLFGGEDGTLTNKAFREELREMRVTQKDLLDQIVQEGIVYICERKQGGAVFALAQRGKEILRELLHKQEEQAKPPVSTRAQPGSEEKIRILQERHRMKVPLWHPDDSHCCHIQTWDDLE